MLELLNFHVTALALTLAPSLAFALAPSAQSDMESCSQVTQEAWRECVHGPAQTKVLQLDSRVAGK